MRLLSSLLALTCLVGSAQQMQMQKYGTTGHPTEALVTPDGQYVLVTVSGSGGSAIDVFRADSGKLKRVARQPLGGDAAQGIALIPHTRTLAVGLSNAGVAFLSLDDTLTGKASPKVLTQGEGAGAGYLAATPDGQFLFVANEYGDRGNIGVIALHPGGASAITPTTLAHIPTPSATPGVSLSPDGAHLYTVGEIVKPDLAARLPGHGVAELQRDGCTQARADRSMPNGVLYVIDVGKAEALDAGATAQQARRAVQTVVDAGCSPVRQASTKDGHLLYLTARGDNRVLVFDTEALIDDPAHAFVRAIASGGDAPVGIALFDGDKKLLVANSNRFAGGPGNVTIFDLADPAKPAPVQTLRTGEFPRNATVGPDGKSVYVTVYKADELLVLR